MCASLAAEWRAAEARRRAIVAGVEHDVTAMAARLYAAGELFRETARSLGVDVDGGARAAR